MRLFSGGLVQGQALQDYVNDAARPHADRAAAACRSPPWPPNWKPAQRTVFVRGNTGQAVRASCSIPGVFEPVAIGQRHYVDGGVVSPVPVDAARQLGADFVIAVDISEQGRTAATRRA